MKKSSNNRLQATAHNLSPGNGVCSLRRYSYTVGRRLNRDVVLTKKNKNLRIPFLIICGFNKRIFLCFN